MPLFAHHVAVELFGREFAPRTAIEHLCAFTAVGLVLALAGYGAWALASKVAAGWRERGSIGSQ